MSEPAPQDRGAGALPAPIDPTLRVDRPPIPGRAVRAEMAEGSRPTPPIRVDEPTVTVDGSTPKARHRTLEFSPPVAVKVTVGPREKLRRRHRTWPWILGVILVLIALGVTLLIMFARGATIDGDTDVIGAGPAGTFARTSSSLLDVPASQLPG